MTKECKKHGEAKHYKFADGRIRCAVCLAERVSVRARRVRIQLIQERGAACEKCGYNKHPTILQFHHRVPAQRMFGVGSGTRGIEKQRLEAAKCDLLCPNCHAEIHYAP